MDGTIKRDHPFTCRSDYVAVVGDGNGNESAVFKIKKVYLITYCGYSMRDHCICRCVPFKHPSDRVGVSFGLYRTVGYVGAILAGSSLKHEFKSGASDAGLHSLGFYSLLACITIVLFMLPLYFKKTVEQ
jgi:hypothetical protein